MWWHDLWLKRGKMWWLRLGEQGHPGSLLSLLTLPILPLVVCLQIQKEIPGYLTSLVWELEGDAVVPSPHRLSCSTSFAKRESQHLGRRCEKKCLQTCRVSGRKRQCWWRLNTPIHALNLGAGQDADVTAPVSLRRSRFQQVADGGQIPLGYNAIDDGRPINFFTAGEIAKRWTSINYLLNCCLCKK